jgi:putative transposase
MPFCVCYYHVVWTTRNREPIIIPQLESSIFAAVHHKSGELRSPVHAVNATEDHIHVAVSVATSVSVAEWVRNIKGLSTREVNTQFPNLPMPFAWQQSYGVLTFGARNLEFVLDYIHKQKDHHRNATTDPYLEKADESD